ncbi:polysaccharide biosynthesis tyrosine autokinase [Bradyrhizobium jicamae]|uniref:non-specific protein-tyrosine kinase n=1 Tax=Bradyrhizobium jicamae TaxID=280332 RepID=A0ABS5FKG4_9BRAD|nr:polysaccharide biosynthesis tyrosine autokinase [Bradyrhizobium jicamae]MBR0797169.1 polysaccharide biosynthesis tyrosine autokinase [Bradyrhizobium jicamae]MBR0934918.1 polysaccharide biosynthesis tyrosine autokinase [Bradyrhizobium jicamae]
MLQTRISSPPAVPIQGAEHTSLNHSVTSAIGLISRQYPAMILTLLLCLGLVGAYLMVAPKRFTGTAVLMIDSRKMQGLQTQGQTPVDNPIDSAMVDSQVEVLKSETIASAVIKDLHLLDSPEFMRADDGLLSGLSGLFDDLFPQEKPSDRELMQNAIWKIQGGLTIKRVGLSYIIEIAYQSTSKDLAARIANAVAENYITDSLESKYQASRRAAVWLQDRLKELRAQASAAERAVVDYKAKNNIVDAGGRLLTEQQLAELNSGLTEARNKRAEAEAKLQRITAILNADESDSRVILNDLATVNDSMANPVITKLRQTYLDYAARASDWANRYGQNHLAVVNLHNQMREIRRSIIDELRRTAEAYKSDLEIAKAREEAGQKSLNDTIAVSNDTSQAQIVLRDLESNAQSARALSDNFLQLYMVSVQQQSFPITEARVITQASELSSPKTSPKTLLVLLAGVVAGCILAGLVALLLEVLDRAFRTVHQVERLLQVNCLASIPAVGLDSDGVTNSSLGFIRRRLPLWARRKGQGPQAEVGADRQGRSAAAGKVDPKERGQRLLDVNNSVGRFTINSPFSRFAESFRSIKLAADLSNFGNPQKVVGITSALPNEGKSTISEALGQTTAQSGLRTLLIDGDLRNPSLTYRLARSAEAGLIDVVFGKVDLKDVLWVDPQTNLHFLPCVVSSRLSNSSDFLASPQMEKLFAQLREQYDRIILDLSPLAPVIDVRATGSLADSYILVIEWAKAKVDVVERVLRENPLVRDHLLGAVLNKVNLAAMSRYDSNSAGYYRNQHYTRYGYVD